MSAKKALIPINDAHDEGQLLGRMPQQGAYFFTWFVNFRSPMCESKATL